MSETVTHPAVAAFSRMGPLLQGKVILVIGASRGIGEGIVRGLAHTGAQLALASRDTAATRAVAVGVVERGGKEPLVLQCDITDAASVDACVAAVVERFGRLDGAVNNAGRSHPNGKLHELGDEDYASAMDANVKGTFYCMRAEIKAMMANANGHGGGSIVNVASVGSLRAVGLKTLYTASKHGTLGLTRMGGLEYATQNIRVNAIAPGVVMTEMVAKGLGSTPEGRAKLVSVTPMGRMADIEEMAGPVIWLLSDLSTYVTGTAIPVDGGWTCA